MTLTLLNIIGAVALLLWGTRMVKNGVTRAFAHSLRDFIAKNTNHTVKAFLAGLGVTTILQSSTATTLICSSFASQKMINLTAALAVVIGADVGTTIVAQILTFDLSWLTPVLLFLGVALHHKYESKGRLAHIARALIGLGIILLSLALVKSSAAPLGEAETLPLIITNLQSEPVLALLIAALMTWVLHSSLAAILIVSSLAATGVIGLEFGLMLVLGINLGGSFMAYIMTFKMHPAAQQITATNLAIRCVGIIIFLPLLGVVNDLLAEHVNDPERALIHFHTVYNVALALLFLPFISHLAKLAEKIIPNTPVADEAATKPIYLDYSALDTPTIAIASASREALHMAKIAEGMFNDSIIALKSGNIRLLQHIRKTDDDVDALHHAIKLYLTKLGEQSLNTKEANSVMQIMTFSTNIEHICDIIENSLGDMISTKITKNKRFSEEGFDEIQQFHSLILRNIKTAQVAFFSNDVNAARALIKQKELVREKARISTERHFMRLRNGVKETLETSSLHTDIIRDYKQINSYITSVAYGILDAAEQVKKEKKAKKEQSSPA